MPFRVTLELTLADADAGVLAHTQQFAKDVQEACGKAYGESLPRVLDVQVAEPSSISEWLIDEKKHKIFSFEIEQPSAQVLDFHRIVFAALEKENKEVDPFWLSSRGTPYLLLALEHKDGEPVGAAYITGIRSKS